MYFPPVTEGATEETSAKNTDASDEAEAKEDAEAKAVAEELPNVPTGELSGPDHVGKKQKHDDA